jgi:hypothetical protein
MKKEVMMSIFVFILVLSLMNISAFALSDYNGTGYGNPSGIFTVNPDYSVLAPNNQNLTLTLSVTNDYVFDTGYFWNFRLNSWVPFKLSGTTVAGSSWIPSSASKTLLIDAKNNLRNGYNYVLTYSCDKLSGSWGDWKCGCEGSSDTKCNKWSLEVFNVSAAINDVPLNISCATDFDCNTVLGEKCLSNACVLSPSLIGTVSDPYLISNCSDLQNMKNNLTAYYALTQNIDCSASKNWNCDLGVCFGFDPVGTAGAAYANAFSGNLNGRGYTVSDLYINRNTSGSYVGLFGYLTGGAVIRNLTLDNVYVVGPHAGALAGIMAGNVGSLILLENCHSSGFVNSTDSLAGGLVGDLFTGAGIIQSCSSSAFVFSSKYYAGGLVGRITGGILNSSFASGNVRANLDEAGGLVGILSLGGRIFNSYAIGDVSDRTTAGGLVGRDGAGGASPQTTQIRNSYSIGIPAATTFNYIGGLVGSNSTYSGSTFNSYWDTQASGQLTSMGGIGKTTAEMKQQATFVGWEFTNVWAIDSSKNNGYPYLRWQVFGQNGVKGPDQSDGGDTIVMP